MKKTDYICDRCITLYRHLTTVEYGVSSKADLCDTCLRAFDVIVGKYHRELRDFFDNGAPVFDENTFNVTEQEFSTAWQGVKDALAEVPCGGL